MIDLIKSIIRCVGTDHITDEADLMLVNDFVNGLLETPAAAAIKYSNGDEKVMTSWIDRVGNDAIRVLLELEVYHNQAQKEATESWINAGIVHKMLYLGRRQEAILLARKTYQLAKRCEAYHISTKMASILARHYRQYFGDEHRYGKWNQRSEEDKKQDEIVEKSKDTYAFIMSKMRYKKAAEAEVLSLIEMVLPQLSMYKDHAESYVYWNVYYQLEGFLYEGRRDYTNLLVSSERGYNYFKELPIDHSYAKVLFLSGIVHAHNLSHCYRLAIEASEKIKEADTYGINGDLLAVRKARAYINLKKPGRALTLLNGIKSPSDIFDTASYYKAYCTGTYDYSDYIDDSRDIDIGKKIAVLYCDLLNDKRDRYTYNYLQDYIGLSKLENTKEGYVITGLAMLLYMAPDAPKPTLAYEIFDLLAAAPYASTEAEVLRYEDMLRGPMQYWGCGLREIGKSEGDR